MKTRKCSCGWLWIVGLLAGLLAGWAWYDQLSLRQKQFIQNIVRQIPDLPARYMV